VADPDDTIHDISQTSEVLPPLGLALWHWVLILFLCIAAAAITRFILNRKKKKGPSEINILENAQKELRTLDTRELESHEFATELSELIRQFITQSTHAQTLFQTQEELDRDTVSSLPQELQSQIKNLLTYLNNFKYSKPELGPGLEKEKGALLSKADAVLQEVDRQVRFGLPPTPPPIPQTGQNRQLS